jgi:uncharacterized membrane protein
MPVGLRVHEVHAAVIHAPLALLPTAAAVDLMAAATGNRSYGRLGRGLWWWAAGSALFAGLAGAAASQEIRADDQRASDMVWLHGIGNLGLLLGAIGIAAWRSVRPPSAALASVGLIASGASFYTAYLGGEMVYGHGIGIRAMPGYTRAGVEDSPALFSRRAPGRFLRDAVAGLRWLFRRGSQAALGRQPVPRESFGFRASEPRFSNGV